MVQQSLDEKANELLREENPTAEAVKALITVKDRESGKSSQIELKTDLSEDEIKIHTVLDVLSNTLEMDENAFNKKCILSEVIERKERKSLSKNRLSRTEIVAVAKQPDMNTDMMDGVRKEGFIRRLFTSRKKPENNN